MMIGRKATVPILGAATLMATCAAAQNGSESPNIVLIMSGDMGYSDMSKDRSELHDLSEKHPEKAAELSAKWEAWAERANVKPWPWKFEGND